MIVAVYSFSPFQAPVGISSAPQVKKRKWWLFWIFLLIETFKFYEKNTCHRAVIFVVAFAPLFWKLVSVSFPNQSCYSFIAVIKYPGMEMCHLQNFWFTCCMAWLIQLLLLLPDLYHPKKMRVLSNTNTFSLAPGTLLHFMETGKTSSNVVCTSSTHS